MYYVYVLKSINNPDKIYVGYTNSLDNRLLVHNDGRSTYTNKYKPWKLHGYTVFRDEEKAINFEKYLKSGSGKAFAKKYLH